HTARRAIAHSLLLGEQQHLHELFGTLVGSLPLHHLRSEEHGDAGQDKKDSDDHEHFDQREARPTTTRSRLRQKAGLRLFPRLLAKAATIAANTHGFSLLERRAGVGSW